MLAPDAQCFYCLLIICSPFTSWQSRNLIPNAAVNIWIFRCRFILSARSFFGTAATVLLKVIRDRIWRTPQYSIRGHTIYVLQRESNIPLVFISSNAEYILSSVVGNITKRNCSACVDFFLLQHCKKIYLQMSRILGHWREKLLYFKVNLIPRDPFTLWRINESVTMPKRSRLLKLYWLLSMITLVGINT